MSYLIGYFLIGAILMTIMWFAVGRHVPPNPQIPAHMMLLLIGLLWPVNVVLWIYFIMWPGRGPKP